MIVIGHRGARGEAPENTLAAFLHAQHAGVRHFELDVRLSWDGRPLVIHDATLTRTTGEEGVVADFPASHLAGLDARRNTPGWVRPCGIPTLEETLVACADAESWQLEVKSDAPSRIRSLVRAMAELVTQLRMQDRVVLTSLDTDVLKIARREAASLARGYVAKTAAEDPLAVARRHNCALLVSNWKITGDSLVKAAHAAGIPISVWTVNDLVVAERLRNLGADSIITDFPTAMLAHVAMRDRLAAAGHAGTD